MRFGLPFQTVQDKHKIKFLLPNDETEKRKKNRITWQRETQSIIKYLNFYAQSTIGFVKKKASYNFFIVCPSRRCAIHEAAYATKPYLSVLSAFFYNFFLTRSLRPYNLCNALNFHIFSCSTQRSDAFVFKTLYNHFISRTRTREKKRVICTIHL